MRKIRTKLLFVFLFSCFTVGIARADTSAGIKFAIDKNFRQAKLEFKRTIQVSPEDHQAKILLEVVEDVLSKKIFAKTAVHIFQGTSYGIKDLTDLAIKESTYAINRNPRYALAYTVRGAFYLDKELYELGIKDFSYALKLNSRNAWDYNLRGAAYSLTKRYILASRDLTKAIRMSPKIAIFYYSRGLNFGKQNLYDLAIRDHSKAIELNSKFIQALNSRGVIYGKQRNYVSAIQDFSLVLKIKPDFRYALVNRGLVFLALNDKRRGCVDLQKGCELGACKVYRFMQKRKFCQ